MINSNLISQTTSQNTELVQNLQKPKKTKSGIVLDKKLDSYSRSKIENLIDKILIGIRENKSPSMLLNSQATKLNISNNLAKDMRDLQNILKAIIKNEPLLEKELQTLENILKPMDILNDKQIKQAFTNSGIFFESKLKEGLRNEKLPNSFYKLISFMKGVKSHILREKFISLSQYDMDAKTSVAELEKSIKDLPGKNFQDIKTMDRFANFLQNMKNYLSLNREKDIKSVFKASQSLLKHIKTIESKLSKELGSFTANDPNSKRSLVMLNSALNKLSNNIYKLELIKNIAYDTHNKLSIMEKLQDGTQKQFITNGFKISKELLEMKNTSNISQIFDDTQLESMLKNESLNLQNASSSLSRILRQNMQIFKEEQFESLNLHKEAAKLDDLIQKAKSSSDEITLKTQDDIILELKDDAKAMLLNINAKTTNESILDITNRLLTQIEINQLISVANNSINMYLPYAWDDLEHSSIVFKRGSDDKYYAQIKLEFEKIGKIHIFLNMWNEKYLDINIMASDESFKMLLIQHGKELKNKLKDVGILCSGFFIQDLQEIKPYEDNLSANVGLNLKA